MFLCFTPQFYEESVFKLPLEDLQARGIKGLILDLDNTLTLWHDDYIGYEILDLLQKWHKMGFELCLLSNNHGHRVEYMANRLGIKFVKKASKPRPKGYLQACRQMNIKPEQAAMIGDQLFTDIWGANNAGILPILVQPMGKTEMWGTRYFSRNLEKLVWHRVMQNYENKKKHRVGFVEKISLKSDLS